MVQCLAYRKQSLNSNWIKAEGKYLPFLQAKCHVLSCFLENKNEQDSIPALEELGCIYLSLGTKQVSVLFDHLSQASSTTASSIQLVQINGEDYCCQSG